MSPEERSFLEDIRQSCDRILRFTEGLDLTRLRRDDKTYSAVLWNLQVIGETVKRLSADIRDSHPEAEWRKLAGLRDILTHAYFGIDDEIIWSVVEDRIPHLRDSVVGILAPAGDDVIDDTK